MDDLFSDDEQEEVPQLQAQREPPADVGIRIENNRVQQPIHDPDEEDDDDFDFDSEE